MMFRLSHRQRLFLLVLLPTICAPVVCQKPIDDLVVTGEVTKVTLCSHQSDAWVYKISIVLNAKNVGPGPLISSTASGMTDFYKIAPSLDELQAKEYAHIGWITSGPGDPKSVPSTPVKPFRVVPPKTGAQINVDVGAIVIGELKPGPAYIQIVAENWPDYSDRYTEKVREAWKSQGVLWAHSLHSEPIAFVVPSTVNRARCP